MSEALCDVVVNGKRCGRPAEWHSTFVGWFLCDTHSRYTGGKRQGQLMDGLTPCEGRTVEIEAERRAADLGLTRTHAGTWTAGFIQGAAWAVGRQPGERERALEAALRKLVDDEPCRFDHHGNCQEHSLGNPCEVEEVRKLLRGTPDHE